MRRTRLFRGGLWALAIATLTWLFVQAQDINHQEHQEILSQLAEMDRQFSLIEQDVLKLRYHVTLNFDAVNGDMLVFRQHLARLNQQLKGSGASAAVLSTVPALSAWTDDQARRLERFKSVNAILGNALTYFPAEVAHLEQRHTGAARAIGTEELLRAILLYDFNTGGDNRKDLEAAGARLEQTLSASTGAERVHLGELRDRFQAIANLRDQTNRLVSELLSNAQPTRSLRAAYLADSELRNQHAQTYRVLLFVVALILLLYAFSVFVQQREHGEALRRALDDLRNQQFALDQHAIVSSADVEGNIIYVNDHFCRISGYSREELAGKNHRILNSGLHPKEMFEELWLTITSGLVWHGQICNRARDGGLHWFNATIVPFLDEAGKPYEYISIRTDITAQKAQEVELVAARDAAEAASRAKSQFLANMSHEIRTPMNGIIGMTGLVLDTTLDAEQNEYLEVVKHSAEHLLTILNDILDFSKIEAGRLEIEHTPFVLGETLDSALRPLSASARAKGLSLDFSPLADLPDQWLGDPVRIRQIMLNLVGNAIKFTETGAVSLQVLAAGPEEAPANLHFIVSDTGIGITAEQQAQIFAPFSQADASTTRRYGGTGLGLAISRQLVTLMGGRLWVESEPKRGSRFHFTLRLTPLEEASPDTGPAPVPDTTEREPGVSLNILVAEDNAVNRHLAVKLLERVGHRVHAVNDGCEAVRAWRAGDYDLAILDMMMPELDGLGATQAIREIESLHGGHIPIIAMTANAFEEDRRDCLAAGMDGFVAKPVQVAELNREISRVLSGIQDKEKT
ncbi:MAG: ATP-binding protein [Rhodocyclaceae bacterium]|nr:ATP-binding protein [Rhodocyclaceae bacterium]